MKTQVLAVRFTEAERALLWERARASQLTLSQYVRLSLLGEAHKIHRSSGRPRKQKAQHENSPKSPHGAGH